MTFETAENYVLQCRNFEGCVVKDIGLKQLDGFMGWSEDIPVRQRSRQLSQDLSHIARYLREEHIEARLEVEIDN